MRDTYFGEDKQPQSMVFPSTHPDEKLRNKPKGIKQFLECYGAGHLYSSKM
ncbi:16961_t:CDS:2 [Entrophospora sp. SA101]|nr:16961_t:CDS:2 [Entrophospora sp. SA101]